MGMIVSPKSNFRLKNAERPDFAGPDSGTTVCALKEKTFKRRSNWAIRAGFLVTVAATAAGAGTIAPTDEEHETRVVRESPSAYTLEMKGRLDRENCITRSYAKHTYSFRSDLMLAIENQGTTIVRNPRVRINGRRSPHNIDELLTQILQGATDPQEKIYRIWDAVRKFRHHDYPIYGMGTKGAELHDPVKFLLVYGGGFCDDCGCVFSSLSHHAGFDEERVGKDPKVRTLMGHVMGEVFTNGDYQFMDCDEGAFYLDRENESPVSGDAVMRDHDLAHREAHYGPQFQGWERSAVAASLFGEDDGGATVIVSGHEMDLNLRPGERIEYLWNWRGGYPAWGPEAERRLWWNSRSLYRPPLTQETLETTFDSRSEFGAATVDGNAALRAETERITELTFHVALPYVVSGATMSVEVSSTEKAEWSVLVTPEGQETKSVETRTVEGRQRIVCPLSPALGLRSDQPVYRYAVTIRVKPERRSVIELQDLQVETEFLANPLWYPTLENGENDVVYEDETDGPRTVSIEHRWQENREYQPPKAPSKPFSPARGQRVRESIPVFHWAKVSGAESYHLLVTTRADSDLPYKPAYDVIVKENEYSVPFTGMFSPGQTYYWRVRACDGNGVWSRWSRTWTFDWQGPRIPVQLRTVAREGQVLLQWDTNPRGEPAVRYKVYGSNIKGFSVSDTRHTVYGLGEMESNRVCERAENACIIVRPNPDLPNQNKTFYRVVAIDANGTESGCSDPLELPHPSIVSKPPQKAVAGEPYLYAVVSLRSLGDLQYHYEEPRTSFSDREELSYGLHDAPDWLAIDKDGVVTGRPPEAGRFHFSVSVTNQEGTEDRQVITLDVKTNG